MFVSAGAFVTGLEFSTGSKAEVIGKPEPAFFTGALETLNHGVEGAVMIGDVCCRDCWSRFDYK